MMYYLTRVYVGLMLNIILLKTYRYRDDQKLTSDERVVIEDSSEGQACSTLSIAHFSPRDIGQVNYLLELQIIVVINN